MHLSWLRVALLNFLIAATIGATLRLAFVVELPWLDYRNAMHAHSHVAMLGWLFMGCFILLIRVFYSEPEIPRIFRKLLWLTQLSVLGMCVSFVISGYSALSIVFCTLHIVVSYFLAAHFLIETGRRGLLKGGAGLFARTALIFMVISTLALWALGPIMMLHQQGSALYYSAVQWFLHFQFNGWFVFVAIAIFLRILNSRGLQFPRKWLRLTYLTLVISCLLTYTLAVTWSTPIQALFYVNGVGVIIQLVAAVALLLGLKSIRSKLAEYLGKTERRLFGIALLCIVIKIAVQAVVVVPFIATVAYTIRNYVIGFIHLILLGAITHLIFGAVHATKMAALDRRRSKIGLNLILAGFVVTEGLLSVQGSMFWAGFGFIPGYDVLLMLFSVVIVIGVGTLFNALFIQPQA